MKRKLAIMMVVLPVLLGAGAWTENSVTRAHAGSVQYAPLGFIVSQASALFVKAAGFASQVPEQACFFALGVCFVLLAWAMHRKAAGSGAK